MLFKRSVFWGISISCVALAFFLVFEGALVQASSTFDVTLAVNGEISLNCPAGPIAMPAISGMTGGQSSATADCGVTTNSATGYTMTVHATGSPALLKDGASDTFADAATTPFYDWAGTVATDESKFGFAVSSTDAVAALKNNGSACGSGSTSNSYCFRGFNNTSDIQVLNRGTDTGGSAVTSTLRFMAEVGSTKNQPTGSYRATVVVTANTQ